MESRADGAQGSGESLLAGRDEEPVKQARSVAIARKQLPLETAAALRTRTKVILSFWVVALLVGVPLWWITTSIYRAPLPLREMQDWSEGKKCKAEFPLLVDFVAPSIADPQNLLKTVQHALDDANDFAIHQPHHLRLRLSQIPHKKDSEAHKDHTDNVACIVQLVPSESSILTYQVEAASRVVEIQYPASLPASSFSSPNGLAQFIAETLEEIFWQEQRLIEHLLIPHSGIISTTATLPSAANGDSNRVKSERGIQGQRRQGSLGMDENDVAKRMSRVIRYAPTYHLTFSLFTGTASPVSWDIESALKSRFMPLLNALSSISNFTISSQVQYYATLTPTINPDWNEERQAFTLKKDDLSSFINSAEWPLASMSDDPTINFILYVPHPRFAPLVIPSSAQVDAFLLPQWGGIMIHNPSNTSSEHLGVDALGPALETFAAHLLALLGAPPHPASLPIRLDSLTRQRSAEVLVSASSTLGSLFRVASNLSSISIPTAVLDSVEQTLAHLQYACEDLSKGHFKRALGMGRIAQEEAEKAFFERSMVAQVYFPEEHKVAVYLPLLGPVGVPLVMGLLREGVRWIKARRDNRPAPGV